MTSPPTHPQPHYALPAVGDGRREANAALVLRTVLDHGPVSRSGIARRAGLSPAAVSRQCTDLLRLGLVREAADFGAGNGVGRPQIPVELTPGAAGGPLTCGVHIGVPQSTFCLVDLRGRVVERQAYAHDGVTAESIPHTDLPHADLPERIGRALARFLAERTATGPLLGVGAAIGGWVDPDTGTVVRHDALGWRNEALVRRLEQHTGLPVRADNHARAVAQSELLFGHAEARRSLLHLFVGNVVDAALAIAGTVHSGPGAGAGEVAHLPVPDSTVRCPCGRTGCLEATVSDTALIRTARERGIDGAAGPRALLDAAAGGDRGADALLRERARAVGRATGLLLDVLNPDLVVVTERAALTDDAYLAELRHAATAYSHVCGDPERLVVPHAGPETLPVAAATVWLNELFKRPLQNAGNIPSMFPQE
ncbi:ROK family transcriptional regulator [Streptomyces sp. ODS28]|uniref:ROK family transcriptional regulator n=1 Tax=Streptomyces sp. ODS28 TaxID=3136688 RepID=UPI0031E6F1E1